MGFMEKLVILLVTVFSVKIEGFYVTSRPVEVTSSQLYSLLQLVTSDIDYRYTDMEKRLTAIKDKDLRSCFVTDSDPHWNLYKSEKESITRRKPFERVRTPNDFDRLRSKAGKVIAHMCKKVNIYWLNEQDRLLPPPMQLHQGNGQSFLPPPHFPTPTEHIPGSNQQNQGQVPPEMLSKDILQPILGEKGNALPEQMEGQAPPEVISKDSVPPPPGQPRTVTLPADDKIEAPPPLSLWRQMHQVNKQPQAPPMLNEQKELIEPPRISDSEFIAPPIFQSENILELHEPPQARIQQNAQNLQGPMPPPKVPSEDDMELHEPPLAQPQNNVPGLQKPPKRSAEKFLEPLPDLRTPPSPFGNAPQLNE